MSFICNITGRNFDLNDEEKQEAITNIKNWVKSKLA